MLPRLSEMYVTALVLIIQIKKVTQGRGFSNMFNVIKVNFVFVF